MTDKTSPDMNTDDPAKAEVVVGRFRILEVTYKGNGETQLLLSKGAEIYAAKLDTATPEPPFDEALIEGDVTFGQLERSSDGWTLKQNRFGKHAVQIDEWIDHSFSMLQLARRALREATTEDLDHGAAFEAWLRRRSTGGVPPSKPSSRPVELAPRITRNAPGNLDGDANGD